MTKYTKKPVTIEATQLSEHHVSDEMKDDLVICQPPVWFSDALVSGVISLNGDGTATIKTLEGDHLANNDDYIIQGIKGELYPCKPDIFKATYEEGDDRRKKISRALGLMNSMINGGEQHSEVLLATFKEAMDAL